MLHLSLVFGHAVPGHLPRVLSPCVCWSLILGGQEPASGHSDLVEKCSNVCGPTALQILGGAELLWALRAIHDSPLGLCLDPAPCLTHVSSGGKPWLEVLWFSVVFMF